MADMILAVCGLDCAACDILLMRSDPAAAEKTLGWFRQMGWLKENEGMPEVIERRMYCTGCLGCRDTHWSADCWILLCCVDQHHLSNCSQCAEFPCDRLVAWSEQEERYQKALARLREMRAAC
jgi:hypothetical protein